MSRSLLTMDKSASSSASATASSTAAAAATNTPTIWRPQSFTSQAPLMPPPPPPLPPSPQPHPGALQAAALAAALGLYPPQSLTHQHPQFQPNLHHQSSALQTQLPNRLLAPAHLPLLQTSMYRHQPSPVQQQQQHQQQLKQPPTMTGRQVFKPSVLPVNRLFYRGTVLSTWAGRSKRVEELTLQDFEMAATYQSESDSQEVASGCQLVHSRIVRIEDNLSDGTVRLELVLTGSGTKQQTRVLRLPAYQPLFVPDRRGWFARDPSRAMEVYSLSCGRLDTGDCIIAMMPRPTTVDIKSNQRPATRKRSHSPE